jgi:hypothetical protein
MKLESQMLNAVLLTGVLASSATLNAASDEELSPNQFGLGLRMGLNIQAKFSHLGGFASAASPGPATGGGLDRTYDDGFVRRDASGNQGGTTWNWGYQNASQLPGNDTVVLHASTSAAGLSSKADGDPQLGMEVFYKRRLGQPDCNWGVAFAFGFTDLDIRDSRTLSGNASVITDAYSLGGITPPVAPYAGSFAGPGVLIGDSPNRLVANLTSEVVSGRRHIDGSLYDFHLGPYYDWPFAKKLTLQLGGGLALGVVDSEFSFYEQVTSAGSVVASSSGSSQNTDLLAGAYAEARLAYRLCARTDAFVGAQFQYLGNFKQRAAGKEAELDLGQTVFFLAGFQVRF